jgi:hypothetical protein
LLLDHKTSSKTSFGCECENSRLLPRDRGAAGKGSSTRAKHAASAQHSETAVQSGEADGVLGATVLRQFDFEKRVLEIRVVCAFDLRRIEYSNTEPFHLLEAGNGQMFFGSDAVEELLRY